MMPPDTSPDDYRDAGRQWDDWPHIVVHYAIGMVMVLMGCVLCGSATYHAGDYCLHHPQTTDTANAAAFGTATAGVMTFLMILLGIGLTSCFLAEYRLRAAQDHPSPPGDPHA